MDQANEIDESILMSIAEASKFCELLIDYQ
jgi:hypothetical protein